MEADALHLNIDYVSSSGVVLSVEQKSALQSSLVILQNQQKFAHVQFWGKILGLQNDYFIVQGVGNNELKDRKTLYSLDCVKWGLMSSPTDDTRRKCNMIRGRFTGDPSHEYEHSEKINDDDGDKEEEANLENTFLQNRQSTNWSAMHASHASRKRNVKIIVKEEDRLAITVENICHDVAIVPRGAYLRTPLGDINVNRTFEGLSLSEASRLSSYYHFRDPVLLHEKSLLQKADLDSALDFLDPIDCDVPDGGSWSVQTERGGKLIVLRSLHWLGFTFFHVPRTSHFGFVYVGLGEKNLDLPFML